MSSDEEVFLSCKKVFAVREDVKGRRQPEFIDQPFRFVAKYKSSGSVVFRLSFSITDSASNETVIYLQITPNRIESLRSIICDTSNTSKAPCIEIINQKLDCNAIRLQFQLQGDMHAQVIVPTDFNFDKFPDSPARCVFSTATSLAAASMFSVYVPHNVLSSKQLRNLVQAIPQFASLTTVQQNEYNRMVDLRGLYNGKGGKEFTPEDQRTPATIESHDATIPFNTQRYPDSPPAYEECLSEGQQSRARSGVAAFSADSSVGDRALSDYGDTERNASKHVLHRGSEDSDLPLPKRNAQLSKNMWRSRLASLASYQSMLELRLERQCQEIRQLQEGFEELQRQNKKLEGQRDDVEEYCCVLEKRQVENGEAIESVAIHADELAGEFEELGKQLLDVCDEVKDWAENNMQDMTEKYAEKWLEENMAEKYMEKWFEENMGEKFMEKWLQENMAKTMKRHIDDQVAAKIAEMKTKMREALLN